MALHTRGLDERASGGLRDSRKRWVRATTARARQWAPSLHTLLVLIRQGVVRPMRPDKILRIARAWRHWGTTIPLAYAVGAIRHPDRPAVIGERGALSFSEVDQRTTRLAHGLLARGISSGSRVGLLCRNHHGPVEAIVACGKIGADVVLLNTGLSTSQLADVLTQQRVDLLVVDIEFSHHFEGFQEDVPIVLAWTEGTTRHATIEHLIGSSPRTALPHRPRHSRFIVLTSGTTGAPKGARRPDPAGLAPAATMFSRIPLRSGERMLVCAPLFHTWGLAAFQLGAVLGATLVLRRKFEPQPALAALQRHRCSSMFAVPVMLQRILDLPEEVRSPYDLQALRVVACSGSALPPDLATRFLRKFGPVLYNVYGSTEVSWASIATPQELRRAPGTAGRPPFGTTLRIVDEQGEPVRQGFTGQILVSNDMLFDGYTHSEQRPEPGNGRLLATGDLGRLDAAGRLFVVGRADDLVISGGENVYPGETEDVIASFPEVAEVAVLGVDDREFGQRLAAFVVLHPGCELDEVTVRDRIKLRVSTFAVPRDVIFLEELPRNATGKVVPRELHQHLPKS